MPRLIFLKLKVSPNITLKFKKETSDLFYICGTSIEELLSKEVYNILHVKKNLTCEDPVESTYYTYHMTAFAFIVGQQNNYQQPLMNIVCVVDVAV